MLKKLLIVIVLLGGTYAGGSYYVGYSAEQRLVQMMNDAASQADGQLTWQDIDMNHGVFDSSGSMVLVLDKLKVSDQGPARLEIDYQIRHDLRATRSLDFDWSVTPDKTLASDLSGLFNAPPALVGAGQLDWSGKATSSLTLPGVADVPTEEGRLSTSPLEGLMTIDDRGFAMNLTLAEFKLFDGNSQQTLTVNNWRYGAESVATMPGAVRLVLSVHAARVSDTNTTYASLSEYQMQLDVRPQADTLSIDAKQTLSKLTGLGIDLSDVEVSMGLDGLHRDDLAQLRALTGSEDQQIASVQGVLAQMLARGLTFKVPVARATVGLGGDKPDQYALEGLDVQVKVDDPTVGAGKVDVVLGSITTKGSNRLDLPTVSDYRFTVVNQVVDDKIDYKVSASVKSFVDANINLGESKVSMTLTGLSVKDAAQFYDTVLKVEDGMAAAQLEQVAARAIVNGVVLAVPELVLAVDDANIQGSARIGIAGLGDAALSTFDLVRQGELDVNLSATGASPMLTPWLLQGKAMGVLVGDGQKTEASYRLKDGMLISNGESIPVAPYLQMANQFVKGAISGGGQW